ncbi:hypothetical protein [Erythrobacter oryzae]|uniref:hypothetical protein n=1 Tax=Erythrobacter oryzae TaxID=3019556 RepID=UPI0025576280|nr:hypothetical protein [Erythrobacter sp. COR-2]
MSWREHFLYWLDSQISVGPLFWYSDLRWLLGIPAIPFLIVAVFWADSPAAEIITGVGLALCVPWGFLIFRRRRIKKESWIESDRFSDQNNGY